MNQNTIGVRPQFKAKLVRENSNDTQQDTIIAQSDTHEVFALPARQVALYSSLGATATIITILSIAVVCLLFIFSYFSNAILFQSAIQNSISVAILFTLCGISLVSNKIRIIAHTLASTTNTTHHIFSVGSLVQNVRLIILLLFFCMLLAITKAYFVI